MTVQRDEPRKTEYWWYVDGPMYSSPQPAVPTRSGPDRYYLPRISRYGTLGLTLFATQSEARRVALAHAKAEAPA